MITRIGVFNLLIAMSGVSLLQGITKDWEHADFELVKKSVNTLPSEKLNTEFCIFEFECLLTQGAITERDTYGLGFTIAFDIECEVGVKIKSVADGFKYLSVNPSFPWDLKSSKYGKCRPKSVPSPLLESDVLVAVGDTEIGTETREDASMLMKKIMFEKFKLSRMDPSNQGNVKCRFGRVLTYQDALEQFEVLVTLPILLIGVTPQDLLELTDITSLKQQVSPMSTPERRTKGMNKTDFGYKSPHRLISLSSTPDRVGLANMDLRDRLGPHESSMSRVATLDMRNRFAAQAADKHEHTVSPNRSVHTVSAKSRMDASPQANIPPKITADTPKPSEAPNWDIDGSRIKAEVVMAAAAVKSSTSGKPMNPFFNPSPKTAKAEELSKSESSDKQEPVAVTYKSVVINAKYTSDTQVSDRAKPEDVSNNSTGIKAKSSRIAQVNEKKDPVAGSKINNNMLVKLIIGAVSLLCVWLLFYSTGSGDDNASISAFTDKPVSVHRRERIFADSSKRYNGLLTPDIIIDEF